ncbi:MAG: hypothetical protein ACLQFR_32460 [Streptosporangiaceae bacterium]
MRTPAVAGPTRLPRDARELAAGLATAAVVIQLLLAQLTLVIAVALIVIGRTSRWRPQWLLLPVLAGWLLAIGDPARVAVAHWPDLSAQIPLGLLLGPAEAALVLWLGWWRYWSAWRPGLVAALRRRVNARALARGHSVTPDGFALGLVTGTGVLATVTWSDAERGVLLAGTRLAELGMSAVRAAMQLRKTVVIMDLAGAGGAAVGLARSLGIPVSCEPSSAELGHAIRHRTVVVADRGTAELAGVLANLRERELRADCLAWITGCEGLEPALLSRLLELGPATGTALLLSSVSEAWLASIAALVRIVTVEGPVNGNLAAQLASQAGHHTANLAAQRPGEFTVVGVARTVVMPNCLLVRAQA